MATEAETATALSRPLRWARALVALVVGVAATSSFAGLFGGLSACPAFNVPETGEFRLEENFGIATNLEIQTLDGEAFGTLDERVLTIGPEYRVLNHEGELVARAKQKLISWGVTVRIEDCLGRHMATVEERVMESLWKVRTTYDILDAAGQRVMRSDKREFGGVTMEFVMADGSVLGRVERSLLGGLLYDVWTGSVAVPLQPPGPSAGDQGTGGRPSHEGRGDVLVVLAVVAAFKTRSDNQEDAE